MLVRAMILGLSLDLLPPEGNVLGHNKKRYDFAAMVPLQVGKAFEDLYRIKTLIIGGAPMPSELRQGVENTHKSAFETYGMTETLTHIAARRIQKEVNTFTTLPGITVSQDEKACLSVDAPHLAETPIHTHDLVTLISKCEFHLRGRIDNVINSGGVKLIPEEIESQLSKVMSSPFFVSSQPDDRLGEALILVIEGEVNFSEISKKIEILSDLEGYHKPKNIYCLPRFQYTENGKIQRTATRSLLDL